MLLNTCNCLSLKFIIQHLAFFRNQLDSINGYSFVFITIYEKSKFKWKQFRVVSVRASGHFNTTTGLYPAASLGRAAPCCNQRFRRRELKQRQNEHITMRGRTVNNFSQIVRSASLVLIHTTPDPMIVPL
jgi:hypothetical protein